MRQDFAEQHRRRAREVLGPHAGAEIEALGAADCQPAYSKTPIEPLTLVINIYIYIKIIQ